MFVVASILGSYAIGQESSDTDWQRGFLNQYCVACHNDVTRTANFTLQTIALELLVLEIGTDIHSVDRSGQTAVHGAANVSGNEIIKFLVAQGADPEAVDNLGRTPHDVAMRTLRPRPITAALLRDLAAN